MSGPAQAGIDTASNRKDAVRKAFNQEYMATQEAMTQAAERARAQVLDQRYTISAHADSVKAGTQAPLGAPNRGGANPAAQPHAQPQTQPPAQGAPYMNAHPAAGAANQVMFDIANELRNIINQEIEQRMQVLAARVEEAILQSLPQDDETTDTAESQDGAAASNGSANGNANKGANAGANGHANTDANGNGNVNGNANTHVKGGGA